MEFVKPLATPEQAAEAWQKFEDLKMKLLRDDDYQEVSGKKYIKRSGLRKLAVFFGLSDRILKEERVDREDGSFMWRMVVEAQAPNGRVSTGVGICDSRERKFAHAEHDVYATCNTRAKNRAISDMIAGGAVSVEEIVTPGEEKPSEPTAAKGRLLSLEDVKEALTKEQISLEHFDFELVSDDLLTVRKKEPWLDIEIWNPTNRVLMGFGGKWVRERELWEVPRR